MMPQSQQMPRDQGVEELVQRILRASTAAAWGIVGRLAPNERVDLAALCWRGGHFHEVGLAIAALRDKESMILRLGTVVGSILYEQSRQESPNTDPKSFSAARRITLASSGTRPMSP